MSDFYAIETLADKEDFVGLSLYIKQKNINPTYNPKNLCYNILHMAVQKNKYDLITNLHTVGFDMNVKSKYKGEPLLIEALMYRNKRMCALLLDLGADVDITNKDGTTVLMMTGKRGGAEFAEFFLSRGASINKQDKYTRTPLIWAVVHGSVEVVNLLLKYGADVDLKTEDGETAYDIAREFGKLQIQNILAVHLAKKNGTMINCV